MKILLDLRVLTGDWSGITVYTANLMFGLSRLAPRHEYILLFQDDAVRNSMRMEMPGLFQEKTKTLLLPISLYRPLSWWHLRRICKRERIDRYYTSQFFWPYGLLPCPVTATIHDIIPLEFPEGLRHSKKAKLGWFFKWVTRMTLCFSDTVLVDSDATMQALQKYFSDKDLRNCQRLYSCIRKPELPESGKAAEPFKYAAYVQDSFLLFVGRQDPYKNLNRLIVAFHKLIHTGYAGNLIIAGKIDPRYPEAQDKVHELEITDRVCFTDFISSLHLIHLYQSAELVIQPSLFEGFGLTALEPYLYGTTCVVSNKASLPEILGEAALYFDPEDSDVMHAVIAKALAESETQRTRRLEIGVKQLERFSPDAIASEWQVLLG